MERQTMRQTTALAAATAMTLAAQGAFAEDISTHVLDTSRGVGGAGIPVVLEMEGADGWTELGQAETQENGRVEGFGVEAEEGTYRLRFDMTAYDAFEGSAFFPEIEVVFAVSDTGRHHHVPVLVSAYGYSTYLGN
jgi:5-hydroxyisourate hydrolase